MHADQGWIITAAVLTLTGVIGWLLHRYVEYVWWWPWIGTAWWAEHRGYGVTIETIQQDEWVAELHSINQLGKMGDLTRPVAQLTHYEIGAVIKDLGRADWLPERWQAAA